MPDISNFAYKLDGRLVATNDAILSGRDSRANAGLNPASDYMLIQIFPGTGGVVKEKKRHG